MAYESFYWRNLLKRDVRYLSKKMSLSHKEIEDRLEEHFSYVEIKLMTTAYTVRKLADSGKLPDDTLNKKIQMTVYKRNKSEPLRPYVDIEKEYDLKNKSVVQISIRKLCNQIIHSYVLQAIGNSRKAFTKFWVTSDTEKDKYLYEVSLQQYTAELTNIANAYVSQIKSTYDRNTGKWIHKRS